jgi:hypothetical protein
VSLSERQALVIINNNVSLRYMFNLSSMISNVNKNHIVTQCFIKKFSVDKRSMEELTIKQIAQQLGIEPNTVKARIHRRGIEPAYRVGPTPLYPPSVVDQIREDLPRGRPKKPKPSS